MKYFVRCNGAPPIAGPLDEEQIRREIVAGTFGGTIEVVEAAGQSERELASSTSWRLFATPPEAGPSQPLSGSTAPWISKTDARRAGAGRDRDQLRSESAYRTLRTALNVLCGLVVIVAVAAVLGGAGGRSSGFGARCLVAAYVIASAIVGNRLLAVFLDIGDGVLRQAFRKEN